MSEADDVAAIVAAGVFDGAWYLARHPDVAGAGLDPLLHYLRFGANEGRRPNAYFDSEWYRARAALPEGAEPLLHYIEAGDAAGIGPNPHFDPTWYRTAYRLGPDALVLADYLARRRTGRFFSPALYAAAYLPDYADGTTLEPVADYIDRLAQTGASPACDQSLIASSGLFDANYYLINGSDVLDAAVDPIDHFCRFGWREGRNPNIYFNTAWYLRTNPEVGRLGLNPLVHYVAEGERANRRPVVYFDPEWYRTRYGLEAGELALAHYLRNRRSQRVSPNGLFDENWYAERHRDAIGPNRDVFAHFLQTGTYADIDPSPHFDSAAYRRARLGRPSRHFKQRLHPDRDNPLVHHLHQTYR